MQTLRLARPAASLRAESSLNRRWARTSGPLLLYMLLSLGMLLPYQSYKVRAMVDLEAAVILTMEADRALHEGQFPVRIAPDYQHGSRLPVFQYYAVLPYTVAGVLCDIPAVGPYEAWKIVTFFGLWCGGFFCYRLCRSHGCQELASVLGGVVFLTSPYLLTDLNARGAFAELIAFNLLPLACYLTVRCLRSRRWKFVPMCAVGWALVGLTHNIAYLYGMMFTAVFCLVLGMNRKFLPRLLRLIAAGVIHAGLVLWFIAPQLKTLSLLGFNSTIGLPSRLAVLTPLWILLAPLQTNTVEGASSPGLGLRVGWPILAFWLAAFVGLLLWRRGARRRRATLASLLLSAAALFAAWSPVDFWSYLPRFLWFVQFPYRLLMFVVLFGAVLAACALSTLCRKGIGRWAAIGMMAVLGLSASTYFVPRAPYQENAIEQILGMTNIDGLLEYIPAPKVLATTSITDADPANLDWEKRLAELSHTPQGGVVALPRDRLKHYRENLRCRFDATRPMVLELPVLYYPDLLQVNNNKQIVPYANAGSYVAIRLAPGSHEIEVKYIGVAWANALGAVSWTALALFALCRAAIIFWLHIRAACTWLAGSFSLFPTNAALVGFSVMVLVVAAQVLISNKSPFAPSLTLSATNSAANATFAFDQDHETAWLAATTGPSSLTAKFSRPASLHGLRLEPYASSMYAGYHWVTVILQRRGEQIFSGDFELSEAGSGSKQTIEFRSMQADKIELRFSEPIARMQPNATAGADMPYPGYSEVEIQWD